MENFVQYSSSDEDECILQEREAETEQEIVASAHQEDLEYSRTISSN